MLVLYPEGIYTAGIPLKNENRGTQAEKVAKTSCNLYWYLYRRGMCFGSNRERNESLTKDLGSRLWSK